MQIHAMLVSTNGMPKVIGFFIKMIYCVFVKLFIIMKFRFFYNFSKKDKSVKNFKILKFDIIFIFEL